MPPDNMSWKEAIQRVLGQQPEFQRAVDNAVGATNGFVGTVQHLQGSTQTVKMGIYVKQFPYKGKIGDVFTSWPDQTICYVLEKPERTRPTRLVTAKGSLGLRLGDWIDVYNESYDHLGRYEVVGISRSDNGQALGKQPSMMLALASYIR